MIEPILESVPSQELLQQQLRQCLVSCVQNGQIAAIDLSGGTYIAEEERQQIVAKNAQMEHETHPLNRMSLYIRRMISDTAEITKERARSVLERISSKHVPPEEILARATRSLERSLSGALEFDKRSFIEANQQYLDHETVNILLVDRRVDVPQITVVGSNRNARPAWEQFMNTLIGNGVIKTVSPKQDQVPGNMLFLTVSNTENILHGERNPDKVVELVERSIDEMMNSSSHPASIDFTARGVRIGMDGLAPGSPLSCDKSLSNLPNITVGRSVEMITKMMQPTA
jgi:hypothetical protein